MVKSVEVTIMGHHRWKSGECKQTYEYADCIKEHCEFWFGGCGLVKKDGMGQ
jgi:hypothetical protein